VRGIGGVNALQNAFVTSLVRVACVGSMWIEIVGAIYMEASISDHCIEVCELCG
jgi:hypothetical protein